MPAQTSHRATVTVAGMTCEHCVRSVREELGELDGVPTVEVTLSSGLVTVSSERPLTHGEIAGAVDEAGYALVD